jgi:protein-S-isoprenylcysteine O-methyltransferase Ste14
VVLPASTGLPPTLGFDVVLALFFLGELVIRIRGWITTRGELQRGRDIATVGSTIAVVAALVIVFLGASFVALRVPAMTIPIAGWWLFVMGLAASVGGLTLRWWAVATLGRWFTADLHASANQTVVEDGPYRTLRHPSYTGMLMVFLGAGLTLGNWLSLVIAIVPLTVTVLFRIHVEERMLLKTLGEPYRRFSATRARLIPHVY